VSAATDDTNTDPLRSVFTSNLPDILGRLNISLVVTTYQAGKVVLKRNDAGTINTHIRTFQKPMGLAVRDNRLTIGGSKTVWYLRNTPAVAHKLDPAGKHDGCYLPRRIRVTGDIDIHATSDGTNTALNDVLDPLADNGSPTETHALVPGSPAIDAGDSAFTPPPTFDQRGPGFARVLLGVIDIGAYEYGEQEGEPEPVGGATIPPDGLAVLGPTVGVLASLIAVLGSGVALTGRRRT